MVILSTYSISFQGHRDQILATAETRERRQRKLEHFFREAYAITFGLAPGEKRRRSEDADPEVACCLHFSYYFFN